MRKLGSTSTGFSGCVRNFLKAMALQKVDSCSNLSLVTSVAPRCLLYCGNQRMCTQVQPTLILLTKCLLKYTTLNQCPLTLEALNSLGPKFSSQGHFHSLQLLNVPPVSVLSAY